jgi:FMN phosphatase YigB (HAD superfamily)
MSKKNVSVVITDLDNTLYDWFTIWHASFRAMLDVLISELGIAEETLLPQIKKVHEKHGTAEYLRLLKEIPILQLEYPGKDVKEICKKANNVYRQKRTELLKLYPNTLETLAEIKKKGCLIIGYTDSQTLYTDYRIKELGLDNFIDYLYSSPTHEFDEENHSETEHFFPSKGGSLVHAVHLQTPKGASKPNPEVLISIIEDIGAPAYEVIYVGDSLINDISMAQAVPVTDVYAKYGTLTNKDNYKLLQAVTFWSQEKVSEEERANSPQVETPAPAEEPKIVPSHTLTGSLAEVLDLFNFIPFKNKECKDKEAELTVDIWKKTIDVQQHFNDLELRIRSFAFTILGIIISAAAVAYKEYETAYLSWVLVLVGLVLWLMFFMMDYYWYHRLLIGSVKQATKIENEWKKRITALGLTNTISESSPIYVFGKRFGSDQRMKAFYLGIAGLLALLSIVSIIAWYNRQPKPAEKSAVPSVTVINNSQSPINTSVNANTNADTTDPKGNSNSGNGTPSNKNQNQ